MAVSNINTIINNDIQKVWNIVLAVDKYNLWRSDLSKTEIINDKQFIEYTKNGYATTFTVTVVEPYKRWEFDMENSNMSGHWIGVFTAKGNETQIDFTENVTPKKWIMKPFVKIYLTASTQARAKRRFDELTQKGEQCNLEEIAADIENRDYADMHREISPLKQAEDAILVDTSDMNIEEVVAKLTQIIEEKKAS